MIALREFNILKAFTLNPLVIIGLLGAGIWGLLLLIIPNSPTPDRVQKIVRYFAIGGAAFSMVYLFAMGIS